MEDVKGLPSREKYMLGRKATLVIACALLACFGIFYEAVLHQTMALTDVRIQKSSQFVHDDLKLQRADALLSFSILEPTAEPGKDAFLEESTRSSPLERLVSWEWYHHSVATTSASSQKRLLIAQYTSTGRQAELFEITRVINMEYAKTWKHDIVFLKMTTNSSQQNDLSRLLRIALEKRENYDQVLILDADTMIFDFNKDITTLLRGDEMLVAYRVNRSDPVKTWKVATGVTLWNLRHSLTPTIEKAWSKIPTRSNINGTDQDDFQTVLKPYASNISSLYNEFNYRDTAVIKYYRWKENTGQAKRKDRLESDASKVCEKFHLECNAGTSESAISSSAEPQAEVKSQPEVESKEGVKSLREDNLEVETSNGCETRRDPTWEWRKYSKDATTKASKKLLVAQYSSYGKYARLLELTSPINKAYARKWNHDFLIVQGATLVVKEDEDCEPPPERSMYDKLELLRIALRKKDEYDQVLLLDADAMIYNLDFDITNLCEKDDILAAHRVSQKNPEPRTYNVNNGIVLWNLQNPETKEVADEWDVDTRKGISKGYLHGDQHYLHGVLKMKNRSAHVQGLATEFFYHEGTVAKHFIRGHVKGNTGVAQWNNTHIDVREIVIADSVKHICERFPSDCEELEEMTYVR